MDTDTAEHWIRASNGGTVTQFDVEVALMRIQEIITDSKEDFVRYKLSEEVQFVFREVAAAAGFTVPDLSGS